MILLSVYLILVNAAGFLLMLIDKRKAVLHRYRIPESVLLSVALCGGSLGCYAAMRSFRHKTRKPLFSIGIPILISLHTMLCVILFPIFHNISEQFS